MSMSMQPDWKNQKYDRQLRLWGTNGQKALESSSICLLGATIAGCETLKNLILPGIGSFVIVDDEAVTEADIGINFFLETSHLGKNRAESCSELLNELNTSVKGGYLSISPQAMINRTENGIEQFNFVIATELNEHDLILLSDKCRRAGISLMNLKTNGMIGYCRLDFANHTIVETHEEGLFDLRLDCPWKELADLSQKIDIKSSQSHVRSHVPFPILLLAALTQWKKTKQTPMPSSKPEKDQFVAMVKDLVGNVEDDENLKEALGYCYRLYSGTKVPANVMQLFTQKPNVLGTDFWILVAALEMFVNSTGYLPLPGKLPDMKADTKSYVNLQQVYIEKFKRDQLLLKSFADQLSASQNLPMVDQESLEIFCKNSAFIQLLSTTSVRDEFTSGTPLSLIEEIKNDSSSDKIIYLLWRSVNRFQQLHNRYPGSFDEHYDSDLVAFKALFAAFLKEQGLSGDIGGSLLEEFVRSGGTQLPTIAAFMGGVASQEIIKLLTHQYLPMLHTFIYNGINSTTVVFQ